jgi:hypothetical protein
MIMPFLWLFVRHAYRAESLDGFMEDVEKTGTRVGDGAKKAGRRVRRGARNVKNEVDARRTQRERR